MNWNKTCLGCADILGIELGRSGCIRKGDKTTHIYYERYAPIHSENA